MEAKKDKKHHFTISSLLWLMMFFVLSSFTTFSSGEATSIAHDGNVDEPIRFHRHELGVGIGFGSNQADHDMDKVANGFLKQYHLEYEGECFDLIGDSYVLANLEYHYHLNRQWDIGTIVAWGLSRHSYIDEQYYTDPQLINGSLTQQRLGSHSCRYFAAMPSIRYIWKTGRSYRFYSGVALGVMRHHLTFDYEIYPFKDEQIVLDHPTLLERYDQVRWRAAYQLNAFGMSIGNDSFHFFFDLGYGCLGVANVGIRVGF